MKILIITYYWPPAGGPGVQRWLKFVKYFKENGIDPVVYVPENPTYAIEDQSLTAKVPEDITIIKRPIFEPYRFAQLFSKNDTNTISKGIIVNAEKQSFIQKVLLYIRGNFFIPDARKFWIKPSVKYLENYLIKNNINTIVTTGPPHSVHLIGKELKKRLNINWLADFRDPWTTIGYHSKLKLNEASIRKHKELEKEVLNTADHLVVTSYTTQKEFNTITDKPISVVTNGYDIESLPDIKLDTNFTISHIGSLLTGRDPKNLWKAIYELTEEDQLFRKLFQLQLVGAVSDDVLSSIKKAGLTDFTHLKGYVSHNEAIEIQRSSQVLLLIEIKSEETKCIIPGKLFEYMVSKRPIIAIGPEQADILKLIKETKAGYFFGYSEFEKIKAQILFYFKKFLKGELNSDAIGIEKYSRRALTKELSVILKNM